MARQHPRAARRMDEPEGAAVSATLFSPPPFSKSPVIVTTPDCSFGDALDTEDFLELRAHRQVKALAGR